MGAGQRESQEDIPGAGSTPLLDHGCCHGDFATKERSSAGEKISRGGEGDLSGEQV